MELILKYFSKLNNEQIAKLEALQPLYQSWNEKINLISRKDFEFFYERHVLHSLSIARFFSFPDQSKIIDIGTGGGFPGIPMAIVFPEVSFHLIDSIQKKIKVLQDVIVQLSLKNVTAECIRAEQHHGKYHYALSRAVAPLPEMMRYSKHFIIKEKNRKPASGLIYLKGGEIEEEISALNRPCSIYRLKNIFEEEFFETKAIIHVMM
jgi:16S rRNA (guanine527-N7)-methyltransferase